MGHKRMARACTQYIVTGSVPLLPRLLSVVPMQGQGLRVSESRGHRNPSYLRNPTPPSCGAQEAQQRRSSQRKMRSHFVLLSRCLFQKTTSTVLPVKVALFLTQLEPALGHVAGFGAFCSDQPLPGQQDLTPKGVAQHFRVEVPASWSLRVLRDAKGTKNGASWEVRAHSSFSKQWGTAP